MNERVRKRKSKWDLKEDPDNFPIGNRRVDASFGEGNESIHDSGAKQDWNSSKNTGYRNSKWSDTNSKSPFKSEGNSRLSHWENPSGSREEYKDDYVSRDLNEVSQPTRGWDGNRSYSASISPGHDDWRRRSRSRSPKRSWSRSQRSRSPQYARRSRSRSPQYDLRSRSRSPRHGLRRDSEGWNDRIGARSRVSVCNDFVRGRCSRGSQCRFLHEENDGYKDRTHSGSDPSENWGSRRERGSSYGYPNNEEQDFSREKFSHGHESQRNNRSSGLCLNFVKGICHRGSSCRFLHEDSTVEGRSKGERTHDGENKPYAGHDYRRESYKINAPCRYFASGRCRKGTDCRFLHEGAAPDRPQGGPADDRWGHSLGVENKSWSGAKWNDEATDLAHGSAGGKSLDFTSGHIAHTSWGDSSWNNTSVGQTWNDTAAINGRSEASSADERWGSNLGNEGKSWGGPKWGNEVSGSANGSVGGRTLGDKTGCISNSGWDEAAQYNQFPGQVGNQTVAADRPEGALVDGNMGYSSLEENKLQEGPKWTNLSADTAHVSVEGKAVVDMSGCIADSKNDALDCNAQLNGMTWNDNDNVSVSGAKRFSRWGNDENNGQIRDADVNKLLGGTKRGGNATESEEKEMPNWKKDNDAKDGVPISKPAQGSLDDRMNNNVDNYNRAWGFPTPDQNMHKPSWTSDNSRASLNAQSSRGNEAVLNFANTPSDLDVKNQYIHFNDNGKPRYGIPIPPSVSQEVSILSHEQTSIQGHHSVPMYPDGQMHPAPKVMMHPSASNMNAQCQQVPLPSPRLRSFDLNGPFEDLPSPNNQAQNPTETIKAAGNTELKMSPGTSGVPAGQNVVTSEQVAQMSHLSASLAQIFGNRQQLPQLYASLNSTTTMGLMHSGLNSGALGASVDGSFVQSNQDNWSQKQHAPVSNSMESSLISIQTPMFSEMPIMQNNTHPHESQVQLSNLPTPVAVVPTVKDPVNSGSLEKEPPEQSNNPKQAENPINNETTVACAVKEQDDTNGRMDEDGKKGKDAKGMRMFKFSLVEIVKEILKPTWKEGQLSKEAHKTIVKKVVDKVSGSVQGEHIQTQEKIDQYLAYSKNKLTKLVEAYVEKYLKV